MENDMNQQQPMPQSNVGGAEQGWEQSRGIALAARIPILFWLPFVAAKGSRLAMYHANQGLLQLILGFVVYVLLIIPILGWLAWIVIQIFNFIFIIIGMIDAYNGRMKPLPLIGGIKIIS